MIKYIEINKKYWGPEFAHTAGIKHCPEHDEIAAMGCYTMLYEVADNFRNGELRTEILKHFGVEE